MQVEKVSLADAHAFSPFFLDYISSKSTLTPFYGRFPLIENFGGQLQEKQQSFQAQTRAVLVETLRAQYEGYKTTPVVQQQIASLGDKKTFTVTTGHQLNIFTGPLYFIFKIVTVINTCKRLRQQYPDHHFVPVYWMASEDHDYDEIKYFRLGGKKYVWETTQTGAVGRFNTKGLDQLANEIPGDNPIFREAYSKRKTLAAATRHYVNELFGSQGLVVIDGDDRRLKHLLEPVIRRDVLQENYKPLVDGTNAGLHALGYKTQVHCRDINFFYLHDGVRNRLEVSGDRFKVVDTDLSFSRAEIEALIAQEPERFSPNVILRPLYQEIILPNIAYVGGPAEVIYWLQLQEVFKEANVPFPILMPRNFAMVIDHDVKRKWSRTELTIKDLFEEKNYLFNHWVVTHSSHDLSIAREQEALNQLFETLKERAVRVDPTLGPYAGATAKRALSGLDKLQEKMVRAEKRRQSDKLRQIEAVKDILFPGGSLQERTDNFLNFAQKDPAFIDRLLGLLDPFDFDFNVLSYPSPDLNTSP